MKKTFVILIISLVFLSLYLFYGRLGITDEAVIEEKVSSVVYDSEGNIFIQFTPIISNEALQEISNQTMKLMRFSTDSNEIVEQVMDKNSNSLQRSAVKVMLQLPFLKENLYEQYYQTAYFGYGVFGINAAANTYFDKEWSALTQQEVQWLLAIEAEYKEHGTFEQKRLTASYKKAAVTFDLDYDPVDTQPINTEIHGNYDVLTAVYKELEKLGIQERALYFQPYEIYSTIDSKAQSAVVEVLEGYKLEDFKTKEAENVQSAIIVANNQSGEVVALASGINQRYFELNRAVSLTKAPGSVFKPIVDYAPALELGYDEHSILQDLPVDLNGYKPKNIDMKYRGEVTLKEAITHSYNLPAVWLLNEIGLKKGKEYASKFGFKIEEQEDYRIGLGYLHNGVSPAQLAQAYTVFENKGIMNGIHLIKAITLDGSALPLAIDSTRVISEDAAEKMHDLLHSVVAEGTAKNLTLPYATSGKTGATANPTQPDFAENIWFVGSTLNLTGAVWLGFDEPPLDGGLTVSSGEGAVPLYEAVFQSIFR